MIARKSGEIGDGASRWPSRPSILSRMLPRSRTRRRPRWARARGAVLGPSPTRSDAPASRSSRLSPKSNPPSLTETPWPPMMTALRLLPEAAALGLRDEKRPATWREAGPRSTRKGSRGLPPSAPCPRTESSGYTCRRQAPGAPAAAEVPHFSLRAGRQRSWRTVARPAPSRPPLPKAQELRCLPSPGRMRERFRRHCRVPRSPVRRRARRTRGLTLHGLTTSAAAVKGLPSLAITSAFASWIPKRPRYPIQASGNSSMVAALLTSREVEHITFQQPGLGRRAQNPIAAGLWAQLGERPLDQRDVISLPQYSRRGLGGGGVALLTIGCGQQRLQARLVHGFALIVRDALDPVGHELSLALHVVQDVQKLSELTIVHLSEIPVPQHGFKVAQVAFHRVQIRHEALVEAAQAGPDAQKVLLEVRSEAVDVQRNGAVSPVRLGLCAHREPQIFQEQLLCLGGHQRLCHQNLGKIAPLLLTADGMPAASCPQHRGAKWVVFGHRAAPERQSCQQRRRQAGVE
eukprot:scaffold417_cov252-Pinguiococcus_pyrenoidosus.AAC.24